MAGKSEKQIKSEFSNVMNSVLMLLERRVINASYLAGLISALRNNLAKLSNSHLSGHAIKELSDLLMFNSALQELIDNRKLTDFNLDKRYFNKKDFMYFYESIFLFWFIQGLNAKSENISLIRQYATENLKSVLKELELSIGSSNPLSNIINDREFSLADMNLVSFEDIDDFCNKSELCIKTLKFIKNLNSVLKQNMTSTAATLSALDKCLPDELDERYIGVVESGLDLIDMSHNFPIEKPVWINTFPSFAKKYEEHKQYYESSKATLQEFIKTDIIEAEYPWIKGCGFCEKTSLDKKHEMYAPLKHISSYCGRKFISIKLFAELKQLSAHFITVYRYIGSSEPSADTEFLMTLNDYVDYNEINFGNAEFSTLFHHALSELLKNFYLAEKEEDILNGTFSEKSASKELAVIAKYIDSANFAELTKSDSIILNEIFFMMKDELREKIKDAEENYFKDFSTRADIMSIEKYLDILPNILISEVHTEYSKNIDKINRFENSDYSLQELIENVSSITPLLIKTIAKNDFEQNIDALSALLDAGLSDSGINKLLRLFAELTTKNVLDSSLDAIFRFTSHALECDLAQEMTSLFCDTSLKELYMPLVCIYNNDKHGFIKSLDTYMVNSYSDVTALTKYSIKDMNVIEYATQISSDGLSISELLVLNKLLSKTNSGKHENHFLEMIKEHEDIKDIIEIYKEFSSNTSQLITIARKFYQLQLNEEVKNILPMINNKLASFYDNFNGFVKTVTTLLAQEQIDIVLSDVKIASVKNKDIEEYVLLLKTISETLSNNRSIVGQSQFLTNLLSYINKTYTDMYDWSLNLFKLRKLHNETNLEMVNHDQIEVYHDSLTLVLIYKSSNWGEMFICDDVRYTLSEEYLFHLKFIEKLPVWLRKYYEFTKFKMLGHDRYNPREYKESADELINIVKDVLRESEKIHFSSRLVHQMEKAVTIKKEL